VSSTPLQADRLIDALLEATVVLSFSRIGYEVRSRLGDWDATSSLPGAGRRVLVTGANSGLGYATARGLLRAGAEVRLLVRSDEKGRDTLSRLSEDLGREVSSEASYDLADLADLAAVRSFAQRQLERGEHLDAVVHNAGAMFERRSETVDGLELTYQVHVVAPFLLTSLLLPSLAGGRVVTVTSGGMYSQKLDVATLESPDTYRPSIAYARAKRAQVVLTREWARRSAARGIAFHAMHPGWVLTPGVESSLPRFRRITGPILRDPDQGADTCVWLALEDGLDDGRLWLDRRPRSAHKVPWTISDDAEAARLWDRVSRDAGVDPDAAGEGARP
jgi:dehydrogenase/reductase SDR family member 12